MIADQRGVRLEDLAINDGTQEKQAKPVKNGKVEEQIVIADEVIVPVVQEQPVTAADLRSMADKLSKQAAEMRRKADEMAPPAKKATKSAKAEA
jgi:hypothetical protein